MSSLCWSRRVVLSALLCAGAPPYTLESLLGGKAQAAAGRGVLRRMRLNFPNQTLLAEQSGNVLLANDTFELASAMPSATTAEQMAVEGFVLAGQLFPHSDIMVAYKDCISHLVKPLSVKECSYIRAFLEACGERRHERIVTFQLLWEDTVKLKAFMVMPKLPAALEPMPPLSEEHSMLLWDHLSSALQFLHQLGFAHCDVKPGNICVLVPVAFVLVDLGSLTPLNLRCSSTSAYVPRDVVQRSSAELDWCMLGMTLAEKCCATHALEIGTSSRSCTRDDMLEHLSAHLPSSMWQSYRLTTGMG